MQSHLSKQLENKLNQESKKQFEDVQSSTASHHLNDYLRFLKKISTSGNISEFIEFLRAQSLEKQPNVSDNINELIAQAMGENIESNGEIETLLFMHAFQLASHDAKKEKSLGYINKLIPKDKIDTNRFNVEFRWKFDGELGRAYPCDNIPRKLIAEIEICNMLLEQAIYLYSLYTEHYPRSKFRYIKNVSNTQDCGVIFSLEDFLRHVVPSINELVVSSDFISKKDDKEFKQRNHNEMLPISPPEFLPPPIEYNKLDYYFLRKYEDPMKGLRRELDSLADSLGVNLKYTNFFEDTLLALANVKQLLTECEFRPYKKDDSSVINSYCFFKFVNLTETSSQQLLALNKEYPTLEIEEVKSTSGELNAKFFIMKAEALRVHILPLIKAYYDDSQHANELERYRAFSLNKNLVRAELKKYLPLDFFRGYNESKFPNLLFSTVLDCFIKKENNPLSFSLLDSIIDCSPTDVNKIIFDYYYLHALLFNMSCSTDETNLIITIENSQAAEVICKFFNDLHRDAAIKKGNEIYLKVGMVLHPHFIAKMSDAIKEITLKELNDREKIVKPEEKQEISQLKKQITTHGSEQQILQSAVNIRFFTPQPPLTDDLKRSLNTLMCISRKKQLEDMQGEASDVDQSVKRKGLGGV